MLRGRQRCFHHSINLQGMAVGGRRRHRSAAWGVLHPAAVARRTTSRSSKRGVATIALPPARVRIQPTSATRPRPRLFSAKAANDGRQPSSRGITIKGTSRKDRRLMERKERNPARWNGTKKSPDLSRYNDGGGSGYTVEKISTSGKLQHPSTHPSVLSRLVRALTPKVPGWEKSFRREEVIALAYRLPLLVAITYLVTDEDASPYVVQASLGPSMLPTIQFVGDIWLVETGAWRRAWRKVVLWQGHDSDPGGGPDRLSSSTSPSDYKVGDLVLWKDPRVGWVSCKRVVGCEGDLVQRYGQYAKLYRSRHDWGIVWPRDADIRSLDPTCGWDTTKCTTAGCNSRADCRRESDEHDHVVDDEILRTLTVPLNCVWVEGDNCLFSVDSRQYGPIPTSWICGRLVFRLWPWNREELAGDIEHSYLSSCWISRRRPVPFPSVDQYLGKRFNFYKVK
jgi:signal peptidase I